MSSTRIDVAELRRAREHLGREGGRIRSELRTLRTSINGVVNSTALQGDVKQAIDASMQNQHIPIINALLECYTMLERGFKNSISEWQEHVGGESNTAIMEHEALNQHIRILDDNNRYFQDFDREIRRIYDRINAARGPLDFRVPNNETGGYARQFSTTRQHLTHTRTRDSEFDFRYTDLENLMRQTRRALGNLHTSVGRSFSGDSGVRLEMANSNRGFRELVEGITSEREDQDRAMLESLRRQWSSQNPMQSYMNLPRPLDPVVLDAWLEYQGMTMNDLNTALTRGMVNGRTSNLNPVLQWMANSGHRMNNGVVSIRNGLRDPFGKLTEETISNTQGILRAIASPRILRQGIPGPVGSGQFIMVDSTASGARIATIANGSWVRSAGTSVVVAGFVWGTYKDVSSGDRTIGHAIVFNGGDALVGLGGGALVGAGAALFTTITAVSVPVFVTITIGAGVAYGASIAYNWAYDNNFLGLQTGIHWIGDRVDDIGQAISNFGEMINPFNWSWGN